MKNEKELGISTLYKRRGQPTLKYDLMLDQYLIIFAGNVVHLDPSDGSVLITRRDR